MVHGTEIAADGSSAEREDFGQVMVVRDMWLTGSNAPSLHTMHVDKPVRGDGLMQATARVNQVFKDKPGGGSDAEEVRRVQCTVPRFRPVKVDGGHSRRANESASASSGTYPRSRTRQRPFS